MSNKTLKLLLGILFVFVAIYFAQSQIAKRTSNSHSGMVKFDPAGSSSQVGKIVINKEQETITMMLKDNIWFMVTNKPLGDDKATQADAIKLAGILDGINVELVSQNENNHSRLGLAENEADKLTFYAKDESEQTPLAIVRVSKLDAHHVREDKMVNVYEWDDDLARILGKNSSAWIDQSEATPSATTK